MDLHIKDVLKKYIKQDHIIGDAYYAQKIRKFWLDILGESINARTAELSFNNGKLSARITSAPLRHELFNNRKQLIEKINEYLKEEVVYIINFS